MHSLLFCFVFEAWALVPNTSVCFCFWCQNLDVHAPCHVFCCEHMALVVHSFAMCSCLSGGIPESRVNLKTLGPILTI